MKLFVITSSRADYGLLSPLLRRLVKDRTFDLKIVVTGSHLSKDFGFTYKEIEKDKLPIYRKVPIIQSDDSSLSIVNSCSLALKRIGKLYQENRPDAIFVLGDRYEIFCAVYAALFYKIPVLHYSGGEKTIGAYDDAIRHSITKLSHLHFVSCNEYKRRVIQLGEDPKRVFNVGSLGVDNIKNLKLMSQTELSDSLNFRVNSPFLLVSYYPETLSQIPVKEQFNRVLNALERFSEFNIIFTKSNADTDGRIISKMIDAHVLKNAKWVAFESLGVVRYLSAIKYCEAVIGNSSSGYTEAPLFNKPTVNIGKRQKGRVKATSILDVDLDTNKIVAGIKVALSDKFKSSLKGQKSLFGNGKASEKIINILKEIKLEGLIQKEFYDLKR